MRFADVEALVESKVMLMDFWCQLPDEEEWKKLKDLMSDDEFWAKLGLAE